MLTREDHNKSKDTDEPAKLATEGPLSEKDQQAIVIDRTQRFGQKALEKWRRLKENIIHKFKK
jgi:hypothetical protein